MMVTDYEPPPSYSQNRQLVRILRNFLKLVDQGAYADVDAAMDSFFASMDLMQLKVIGPLIVEDRPSELGDRDGMRGGTFVPESARTVNAAIEVGDQLFQSRHIVYPKSPEGVAYARQSNRYKLLREITDTLYPEDVKTYG